MASFAIDLALLLQPAHQRVAELIGLIGVAGEADFRARRQSPAPAPQAAPSAWRPYPASQQARQASAEEGLGKAVATHPAQNPRRRVSADAHSPAAHRPRMTARKRAAARRCRRQNRDRPPLRSLERERRTYRTAGRRPVGGNYVVPRRDRHWSAPRLLQSYGWGHLAAQRQLIECNFAVPRLDRLGFRDQSRWLPLRIPQAHCRLTRALHGGLCQPKTYT